MFTGQGASNPHPVDNRKMWRQQAMEGASVTMETSFGAQQGMEGVCVTMETPFGAQ